MRKYPKYKPSGVEWMGEIPEHWVVISLKYIVNTNQKTLPETTNANYELNYVEISDVDSLGNIINQTKFYFSESPSRCRRVLTKGDVFISTVRTYLKSIGYVKDNVQDLVCSTGFCVLTPKDIQSEFLFYMVTTEWFISEIISKSEGVSYPSITSTELIRTKVLLPPLPEQQQIVQFLENKTKLIDRLIDAKEKKIELLKEQRISLINQVITKGLDPNVKMKDSGVEWIGEIPEHWKMMRIGLISELLTGNPWKSELFDFDEGVKIVRGENVSEGFLRWGDRTRYWKNEIIKGETYFLKEGDIIIAMDGSKVGKNYVLIRKENLPLLLHQRMCRIRCFQNILPDYLNYYIGSEMFRYYIDLSKTDPMIPHITQKDISDFKLPLPLLKEQQQIVEYLDIRTKEIDDLISMEQKKIDLLKEYRQSLISDVVTGKIDVRKNTK